MKSMVLFLSICILTSCSSSSFKNDLYKKVSLCYKDSKKIFDMKDIYEDWDSMYIFLECFDGENIERIVGKTNHVHDCSIDLVFIKGGKIVEYKQLYPYENWPQKPDPLILFDLGNDSCCLKLFHDSATLKISNYRNCYILKPTSN